MIASREEIYAAVRSFQGKLHTDPDQVAIYECFITADYAAFLRTARDNSPEVNQARIETIYAYAAQAILYGASAERIDRFMYLLRMALLPTFGVEKVQT